MPLDGISTRCLKNELSYLIGAKINKINQPKKLDLVFNLYKNDNYKLYLSANASSPRINLINDSPSNPMVPPNFCMVLRKHLQGGTILDIKQYKLDRVIQFDVSAYDDMGYKVVKSLFIEMMGRHSNIILVESGIIIDSIKRINNKMSRVREVLPGKEYKIIDDGKVDLLSELTLPSDLIDANDNTQLAKIFYKNYTGMSPAIGKEISYLSGIDPTEKVSSLNETELNRIDEVFTDFRSNIRENNFTPCLIQKENENFYLDFYCFELSYLAGEIIIFDSFNDALNIYYSSIVKSDKLKDKSANLLKIVNNNIEFVSSKLDDMLRAIEKSKDREIFKVYADVLSANLHVLRGGESSIKLQNFYSEDLEEIEIPLDETKSGPLNSQAYYKKYSKLKNREKKFTEEVPKLEEELAYLKLIKSNIDNIEDLEDLLEIDDELVKQGYIKKKQSKIKDKKNKNKGKKEFKALKFRSSEGEIIYVGKNNTQNDYITLKLANKDDIFLHIQTLAGSHVIIRKENEISSQTLYEAAFLAGYYSSMRGQGTLSIDYTEKKNVYKAKGAKPGMVYYKDFKTLLVDMNDEKLKTILKNKIED